MTLKTRIDLKVPYAEKDQAKVHRARWDRENQTWYAPPGTDLETSNGGCPGASFPNPLSQIRPRRRMPKRVSPSPNYLVG